MNRFKLNFQHFGLAVSKVDRAKKFLEGLGYSVGNEVEDSLQNVFVLEASHSQMPRIEIVWPRNEGGPLEEILKKGNGLIYHSCFNSVNRNESLKLIEEAGFVVKEVSPPKPAPLFGGKSVSFHYVNGFGLIEILEI